MKEIVANFNKCANRLVVDVDMAGTNAQDISPGAGALRTEVRGCGLSFKNTTIILHTITLYYTGPEP